jgi:hypothetical protein
VISLTSYWPSYHEIDSGFKFGCVMPSAIFTRFGTQSVPLLAPRRSLQSWWGLGGTATKRLLPLRNLHLSGMLEGVCRTWWVLYWRLFLLYSICFCYKSLDIIFPVFME